MKRIIFSGLFLYTSIFILNYLIDQNYIWHIDKSGGIVPRILGVSIFSALFLSILLNRIKKFFAVGFIIGILSKSLVYAIYIITNLFNGGNNPTWVRHTSSTIDALAAATIVFIFGILYYRRIYITRK